MVALRKGKKKYNLALTEWSYDAVDEILRDAGLTMSGYIDRSIQALYYALQDVDTKDFIAVQKAMLNLLGDFYGRAASEQKKNEET